jgi:hypothetical protein
MADPGSVGTPRMIRGSVVVQRRRCGKANCRCADGEALHEATVLSYSESVRSRTVMLAAPARWRRCARLWRVTGPRRPGCRRPATEGWPRCCPAGPPTGGAGECVDGAAGGHPHGVQRAELRLVHTAAHRVGVRTRAAHHHRDDRGGRPGRAPAPDAYHPFVRDGAWSMPRLWQALAVHAVARFAPTGVVALDCDDTLFHKAGRRVNGAGTFRDPVRSTRRRVVYALGLNLVVVTLRVTPPWGGARPRCRSTPGCTARTTPRPLWRTRPR